LVQVRLVNRGTRTLVGTARLSRSPYMHYPKGLWPASRDAFARGLYEIAGTRKLMWQFVKMQNEVSQVLGFLMLDPGGASKVVGVSHPGRKSWWSFFGAQRAITLKPGAAVDVPLVFISVPSPDPKSKKPAVPDLAKVLEQIKPDVLKALRN